MFIYIPEAWSFGDAALSDTVENVTHGSLKSIQAGIAGRRAARRADFDEIKTPIAKERGNSAETLVMMRATAGDFDARVNDSEAHVAVLEERV